MAVPRCVVVPVLSASIVAPFVAASLVASAQEPPARRTITVQITPAGFRPANLTVGHGDILRFVQRDDTPHNVEFVRSPEGTRMAPEYVPPVSDGGGSPTAFPPLRVGPYLMAVGETYQLEIDAHFAKGVYEFGCTSHGDRGLRGLLVVEDFEIPRPPGGILGPPR